MKSRSAKRQKGMALLALLLVIMLGASWFLVRRLNAESGSMTAIRASKNAEILKRAKQALIGYVAAQAVKAGENRPGALPCPEAPADFNVSGSEGTISYPCSLPIVGRFPWRSLGLDKLVDASGEPLWYAVASGWAGAGTVINSDCASPASGMACATGRLSVDGVTNDVIALLIAPGPAITVAASANCASWTQTRPTVAPPDWRNYLECQNASSPADVSFATTGPSGSFNDQVMTITVGDLMPAVEAAIANRIEREIVPALNGVYTPAAYGFSGTNPVYPYAAVFNAPNPGSTNLYQGTVGNYSGLLPMFQTVCSSAQLPCSTSFLSFSKSSLDTFTGNGGIHTDSTCNFSSSPYVCTGQYDKAAIGTNTTQVSLHLRVTNVAGGLRKLDASQVTCTAVDDVGNGIAQQTVTCTVSAALQSDGSAILTFTTATLPDIVNSGWGTYANYTFNVGRAVLGNHALVDTTDATVGWFARNEWFRQTYYAVAAGYTASTLPPSCITGTNCLSVANLPNPPYTPNAQRAILILGGRSVNGSNRPSTASTLIEMLADYFEFGNVNATYERRTVTPKPAAVYTDTGGANAYSVAISSMATGATFQFRAANANTGTSTLNTTATGTHSLVNQDGSNLATATIMKNAAVQVTWNGTQFVLSKRPFNDRIVVIGSN
jgi:hypothetical protein